MPEPRYRGESWQHSRMRADLEAAEAKRSEQARTVNRPAARTPRPAPEPESAPSAPPEPTPRPRRTWRDLSPDELNRYALSPTESRHP